MDLLHGCNTVDGGLFVPVLGKNIFVRRRRLAGGGKEPPEGASKMGMAGKYLVKVWSG